ncbi:ABC transporter ATP-binding protein [Catenulispora pinisilvae]|uniref:ABC transporter ATP-binding protein n=1 Tax=Catenulispora pinisilvae TaxID=2705253 RepID=UPI001891957C|nr:ABC transporter ATP-binding protein [Catenulispora pinisilvae]
MTSEVVLEAEALTKHFPVRARGRAALSRGPKVVHAVDDVSLSLRRGRVTALVGESGSGKSTVARLLAQLYPRTGGDIRIGGVSTAVKGGGRHFKAYARRVQMIFQDPFASLNPVHTVRHHLTRALKIHGRYTGEGSLDELLGRVQLTPASLYLEKYPHELSGGQRQRVSIARALAADPEALLADEPVSMLDVSIRLGVLNLLRDLKERLDLAVLYITHDIASARYFADETLVMYAGRMVEGGDSETVTQRPAHPYTHLLVHSAPDPERVRGGPAPYDDEDTGEPPSLIDPPSGCRFHPRCPKAMDVCRARVPEWTLVGDAPDHWVACWLFDDEGKGEGKGTDAEAADIETTDIETTDIEISDVEAADVEAAAAEAQAPELEGAAP